MTEAAQRYRRLHRLLGRAKASGWKITLITSTGHWRLHHLGGATVTVEPWPSARALLAGERGFDRIERANTEAP